MKTRKPRETRNRDQRVGILWWRGTRGWAPEPRPAARERAVRPRSLVFALLLGMLALGAMLPPAHAFAAPPPRDPAGRARGLGELGGRVAPRSGTLVVPSDVGGDEFASVFAQAARRVPVVYAVGRSPAELPAAAKRGVETGLAQNRGRGRVISYVLTRPDGLRATGALVSQGRRPLGDDLDDLTRAINDWSSRWGREAPARVVPGATAVLWQGADYRSPLSQPAPAVLRSGDSTLTGPEPAALVDPAFGGYEHGGAVGYIYVAYPYGMTKISVEGWRFTGERDSSADYWLAFAHQESNPGSNNDWPGGWRTAELRTKYWRHGDAFEISRCRPATDDGGDTTVSFTAGWNPEVTVSYAKPDIEIYNESSPPTYAKWRHRFDIFRESAQGYHYASPVFEETVPQGAPFQTLFYGTAQWRKTLWGLFLSGIESWPLPPFTVSLPSP